MGLGFRPIVRIAISWAAPLTAHDILTELCRPLLDHIYAGILDLSDNAAANFYLALLRRLEYLLVVFHEGEAEADLAFAVLVDNAIVDLLSLDRIFHRVWKQTHSFC